MRYLFVASFLLLNHTLLAQIEESVLLNWKVDKGSPIHYTTIMHVVDTESRYGTYKPYFEFLADSSHKEDFDLGKFFKKISHRTDESDMETTLTNTDKDWIEIVMTSVPKETKKKDSTDVKLNKLIQEINQGVVLRGSVYKTGGIHSFWLKSSQKNLIAFWFQLPDKPVKVGDSWSIDVNYIGNDQSFTCDSSFKKNEVTLIQIKKVNGETVAVLKYDLAEYVHGSLNMPFPFGKKDENVLMDFKYRAVAEFSVDQGKWISYNGVTDMIMKGQMDVKTKTIYSLSLK